MLCLKTLWTLVQCIWILFRIVTKNIVIAIMCLIIFFFIKVHSNALTNTELLSMLNNQNKPQEHQFDLIITSPMFNELGVMLGKVFAVVIWPLYYKNIYWRGHVFYSNNTFLTCQWWTYSINVSRWVVNMASICRQHFMKGFLLQDIPICSHGLVKELCQQ